MRDSLKLLTSGHDEILTDSKYKDNNINSNSFINNSFMIEINNLFNSKIP